VIITGITITIDVDGGPDDEGLQPKEIVMNGNNWKMPENVFPRDLKFLANLQELIERYNRRTR
jgi:hypothetical protein